MTIANQIRDAISDRLWLRAVRKHKSRLGRKAAPKFTDYLNHCRQRNPVDPTDNPDILAAARSFDEAGVSSVQTEQSHQLAQSLLRKIKDEERGSQIWDSEGRYANGDIFGKFEEIEEVLRGDAGDFIRAIYGANFKIFYGVLYRSVRDHDVPEGSQLWHADGGPGTCINFMYCLSPISAKNGSMECLPWSQSVDIYVRERATLRAKSSGQHDGERDARAAYYRNEIEQHFNEYIVQPECGPGLLYAFRNNCIHKGGFVQPGEERYVIVFHIYPSLEPTPFEEYRGEGIGKRAANPNDPAF